MPLSQSGQGVSHSKRVTRNSRESLGMSWKELMLILVDRWKNSIFLTICFPDTDSVNLFNQNQHNSETFDQYFPKFLLQNSKN